MNFDDILYDSVLDRIYRVFYSQGMIMKYRNLCINGVCLLICLLVGYYAVSDRVVTRENENKTEWLPGLQNLGPLSPAEFYNYNDSIYLLGSGKANGAKNGVEIEGEIEPEGSLTEIFDVNYHDERYTVAIDLMREGRLHEAEILLQDYLKDLPMHADAWRQLGDCEYNIDRVQEALYSYENALKYEPENYLAMRGKGVAALYLGYQCYDLQNLDKAHSFFQLSLSSFHACLEIRNDDKLSAYGQSLAAEGVSRKLYSIAKSALNTKNHDQAKKIIRNCMDIIDTAIAAAENRIKQKPGDDEAKMLLSSLLVRRAKILQPFGHIAEASGNLDEAMEIIEPIAKGTSVQKIAAENQIALCIGLKEMWRSE